MPNGKSDVLICGINVFANLRNGEVEAAVPNFAEFLQKKTSVLKYYLKLQRKV